jgi:basic membrane protein A
MSFSQSMYGALEGLKDKFNLQIAVTDNAFVVQDAANAIRQYASEGYNLVIAHGSQYGSTLQQLAPQFPKVSFAWGTAGSTFNQPNIFAYQIAANEGAYVQGYMAALLTKSHVLGIIGPINVGDGQLYADGFKAGALAADPKANVRVTFTGSFSDVSLMANAAKAFIAGGADMLTGSAQAVVGAIGVAKTQNVAWFGNDADQASLAPQQVVSSNVYDWTGILTQMLNAIDNGTLGGASYTATLGNGGMKISFNPTYNLPESVKSQAQAVIEKITSGSLTVPQ